MTDKMKPCPFCATQKPAIPDGDVHYVVCRSCESEGPVGSSRRAAIEAWNTRPAPVDPQLQATMDGITAILRSDAQERDWQEVFVNQLSDVQLRHIADSKDVGTCRARILNAIRALPLPAASTGSE